MDSTNSSGSLTDRYLSCAIHDTIKYKISNYCVNYDTRFISREVIVS
jgi:hypothetical protein